MYRDRIENYKKIINQKSISSKKDISLNEMKNGLIRARQEMNEMIEGKREKKSARTFLNELQNNNDT